MTEFSWSSARPESSSFGRSSSGDQPSDRLRTMRPTDDPMNAGVSAPVVDERTLRKRKRDLAAAQNDGTYLDHPGGAQNPAVDLSHNFQAASYNADANKRVKFGGRASQSVIRSDQSGRVPLDRSELPGELWQHVFKFLPPHTLGRLLRVRKSFNRLLTPDQAELPADHTTLCALKYVHPNTIWAASRKIFYPGMPRPLAHLNELQMWNLVVGTACQFCNKRASSLIPDAAPWEAGPGRDGVRVVWPFGVRACGECLEARCEKEMDLLLSSTVPSVLMPAIPFAFFTPSMHYVSSSSLRGLQLPPGLTITKLFLKGHIDDMKRKFEEVKSLGPGVAEEWIKGLEGNGKERLADAARWEQFEYGGNLPSLKVAPQSHHSGQSDAGFRASANAHAESSTFATNGKPATYLHSPPYNASDPNATHPTTPPHMQHRGERSLREVNEAKTNRKAEIERRCLELNPPLTTNVLSHMDSFTAAIQIPHHFTDRDWQVLKPRLLNQREVAERREQERIKQEQLIMAKSEERRQQETQLREAKDAVDKEWEEIQRPIKERLGEYADEIIREGWRNGDGVTKDKCPKFAADVLIYVKDRFYADLAKEDAKARAEGRPIEEDIPKAPPKRKIILENMKWVFDMKIKPFTERFQKELFLCNGCEGNTKYYGFEGVIQHYAAKHTAVLSLGSVVVHWRAAWPETPPFHPHPNEARALMFAMPRPIMGQPNMYSNPYMHGTDPGHPMQSPGPYSRTPYGTPYAYGTGPYRPPSPGGSQLYPGQPPRGYGYAPPVQPPPPNVYGSSPYPGPAYQPPSYPPPYGPPPQQPYNATYGGGHNGPRRGGPPPPNGQGYGSYPPHIDEIVKISRQLWNGTSGIKDFPHDVRAQVLIHHVIARFAEKFPHEPALSLFSEAFTHPNMKPFHNLNGLRCKSCASRGDHRRMRSQNNIRGGDRKMYTLPALVNHFLSSHGDPRDWKTEILALPDDNAVKKLANSPGMDDSKFRLLQAAFNWVFPPSRTSSAADLAGAKRKIKQERPGPSGSGLEITVDNFPRFRESPHRDGGHLEPPRDNEYDPHKPAPVGASKDVHPATHRASLPIHGKDRPRPRNGPLETEVVVPRPGAALPDERPRSGLRHVSEDGEVAESHHPPAQTNESGVEDMNAAERFLSSFDPGQSRDGDRPTKPRGRWLDAPDLEDRRYRKELDYGAPPDAPVGAAAHTSSRGYPDYGRPEPYDGSATAPPPRHPDDMTPDPADPRHAKRNMAYVEPGHPGRRPNSRFERYEAQRQTSVRPRSRSPAAAGADPLAVEATYYRERSPNRAQARQRTAYPPEPYSERVPVERVAYGRAAPPVEYYMDDPRYAEPAYEMEYIPSSRAVAREPQGAYYLERPMTREVPQEFVDYEFEYPRAPVYESAQPYPPGSVPRDAQGMPRRARYR